MTEPLSDDSVRRYLLHELHGAELVALEQQLIESPAAQEQVDAIEAELVDDYAADRLAPEQRAEFETHYMSTVDGRRKVEFAHQLQRDLRRSGAPAPRILRTNGRGTWWRVAATGLAAVVIMGVARVWSSKTPSKAPEQAYVLRAESMRGARTRQPLVAPRGATNVLLELELPSSANASSSYRVIVQTPDGDEVWRAEPLAAQRGGEALTVQLSLDLRRITGGDYLVRASERAANGSWQEVADYSFRLER